MSGVLLPPPPPPPSAVTPVMPIATTAMPKGVSIGQPAPLSPTNDMQLSVPSVPQASSQPPVVFVSRETASTPVRVAGQSNGDSLRQPRSEGGVSLPPKATR